MIEGIIFCLVIYLAYRAGWESAHRTVALECQRNGGFFVGKKTFKCTEVTIDEGKQT